MTVIHEGMFRCGQVIKGDEQVGLVLDEHHILPTSEMSRHRRTIYRQNAKIGPMRVESHPAARADYALRIAPMTMEVAPGKIIQTFGCNGTAPGPDLRLRELATRAARPTLGFINLSFDEHGGDSKKVGCGQQWKIKPARSPPARRCYLSGSGAPSGGITCATLSVIETAV